MKTPLLVNALADEATFINQATKEYSTIDMPKESQNQAMGNHIGNPPHPLEQISIGSENSIRKDFGKTEGLEELCRKNLTLSVGKADFYHADNTNNMFLHEGCNTLRVLYKYGSSKANTSNGRVAQTLIDMLLLENQIPFTVLFQLHKLRQDNGDNDVALLDGLIESVKNCYDIHVGKLTPLNAHRCKCKYTPENLPKHLLQLVHSLCGSDEYCVLDLQQIKTATELKNNGVSFEKNDEGHTLFDIHLKEGTMKIPGFRIDEFTESFLRSMIAYEQHPDVAPKAFTYFVLFMSKLINTPKDAELLSGIIDNFHGTNRVQLFSELCGGVKTSSTSTFSVVINKQEVGDCAIDITEENQTNNSKRHIPRVPEELSETNPSAYKPMLISIGLYYRIREPGSENRIKIHFQRGFLENTVGLEEQFREKLTNCVDQARIYYTDRAKDINDKEFVEMLMGDGCFILQFLKSVKDKKSKEIGRVAQSFMEEERKVAQTLRDMLLLENQIPFFVLFELYKLKEEDKVDEVALLKALFELVNNCYASQVHKLTQPLLPSKYKPEKLPKHLLELVYSLCIPTNATRSDEYDEECGSFSSQISATELEKHGVSFQKIEVHSSLFDIGFEWGTMKIRSFRIDDFTETLLRNMIAYEQHSDVESKYFIDFVLLMSFLIDTPEDVKLLRGKGIIANFQITADKEKFFSQLLKGVDNSRTNALSTLSVVIKKVSQHCDIPLEIWMGNLRQQLTNNPWIPIAAFTAAFTALFHIVCHMEAH